MLLGSSLALWSSPGSRRWMLTPGIPSGVRSVVQGMGFGSPPVGLAASARPGSPAPASAPAAPAAAAALLRNGRRVRAWPQQRAWPPLGRLGRGPVSADRGGRCLMVIARLVSLYVSYGWPSGP